MDPSQAIFWLMYAGGWGRVEGGGEGWKKEEAMAERGFCGRCERKYILRKYNNTAGVVITGPTIFETIIINNAIWVYV